MAIYFTLQLPTHQCQHSTVGIRHIIKKVDNNNSE